MWRIIGIFTVVVFWYKCVSSSSRKSAISVEYVIYIILEILENILAWDMFPHSASISLIPCPLLRIIFDLKIKPAMHDANTYMTGVMVTSVTIRETPHLTPVLDVVKSCRIRLLKFCINSGPSIRRERPKNRWSVISSCCNLGALDYFSSKQVC